MSLSSPPPKYDQGNEAQTRAQIEQKLAQCRQKGDLEVNQNERFVMTSPDGTRWVMGVSNAGVTTWTHY